MVKELFVAVVRNISSSKCSSVMPLLSQEPKFMNGASSSDISTDAIVDACWEWSRLIKVTQVVMQCRRNRISTFQRVFPILTILASPFPTHWSNSLTISTLPIWGSAHLRHRSHLWHQGRGHRRPGSLQGCNLTVTVIPFTKRKWRIETSLEPELVEHRPQGSKVLSPWKKGCLL